MYPFELVVIVFIISMMSANVMMYKSMEDDRFRVFLLTLVMYACAGFLLLDIINHLK